MRNHLYSKRLLRRWTQGKLNFKWVVRAMIETRKRIEEMENTRAEIRYFLRNRAFLESMGKFMPTSM
jgi:hypothetical protein